MRIPKTKAALMIGALGLSRLVACSPSTGNNGLGGGNAGFGSLNAGGQSGLGGNGTGTGSGTGLGGDPFTGFDTGGGGPTDASTSAGGGCPELTAKPEEIITYRDATVTDTIVTYSPVALYIMQDRSGSMITGFPEGSAQSWSNSTAAVSSFVNDPNSATVDVGLGFFPAASTNAGACDGSDCKTPIVEIAPASKNAAALTAAYTNNQPLPLNFTPTECALRGMIQHCEDWTAKSGEQCVAVLVTDGNPTLCDTTTADLVKIVADGKAAGVTTFTLGLPGSTLDFLNQLAVAGGTNAAIDVSGGSAAFTAALNSIRNKVSITDKHQISIPTTIATPLPCEWNIPPPPVTTPPTLFQKDKVNVTFTPKGGTAQGFGYVAQADCARLAAGSGGWYYDDVNNPTKVLLCDTTCQTVKASVGAEVDLGFGCAQRPGKLQ